MKMDALVKSRPERGLWLESIDVPVLNEGEALIKIRKTAICGTDVHIYEWNEWSKKNIKTPMTIGHEFVGEIVEIKGDKGSFSIGDIVSAEGHIVCNKCLNCRIEKRHLCPNTKGIGVNRDGIFAEYAAIPLSNLWLCDNSISEDLYSIFDPYGNATHTALSHELIGEDVLITGAGPIGIMAAAICRFAGARNVVLTNRSDYRLELAKKVCKDIITVNVKKENLEDVRKRHNIVDGFGVGLEMSGNATALNQMLDNMQNGGNISLLGLIDPGAVIDWDRVIFGGMKIKGIYGREMYRTWQKMTSMLQGGLDISGIITHRFNYKDFTEGFELMSSGKSGKIILDWTKK